MPSGQLPLAPCPSHKCGVQFGTIGDVLCDNESNKSCGGQQVLSDTLLRFPLLFFQSVLESLGGQLANTGGQLATCYV